MIHRLLHLKLEPKAFPWLLLGVLLLAYGLLIPWLGFYWDDLPILWIGKTYGAAGLRDYFATNRPVWGLFFQASMALLGDAPWQWQLYGLFWRWIAGLALWQMLRRLWPKREETAAWISLAFSLYPGFGQQAISVVYSHFLIVMAAFFTSLSATLRALRSPRRAFGWHALGLGLSAVNLLSMEYFYLLELLRPWLVAQALAADLKGRERYLRSLRLSLPYLGLFVAIALWRMFGFKYQTYNYQPHVLQSLLAQPFSALGSLVGVILKDSFSAGLLVWLRPLWELAQSPAMGRRALLLIFIAVLGSGLGLTLWARSARPGGNDPWATRLAEARPWLILAGLSLLLAGWPFWLTGLEVHFGFPNDRFTLPFMLGAACLLAGLLGLLAIPWRSLAWVLLLSLATGFQVQNAWTYSRDWETQRALFWQMRWRIPALTPGSTLVFQGLPLHYYSDNSLTAALNWIYAPGYHGSRLNYLLVALNVRRSQPQLMNAQAHQPIFLDYLVATFTGSTDQVIALAYQPPGCLRVIDPASEADNLFLPADLRRVAAALSSVRWIDAEAAPPSLPWFYGAEPEHRWCYYYEQADLARQRGDWSEVARLGEVAFNLGDYPNDPSERLPFIEAYAHLGEWERALALSREAASIAPTMQGVVCRLWQRMLRETAPAPEREQAFATLSSEIACAP